MKRIKKNYFAISIVLILITLSVIPLCLFVRADTPPTLNISWEETTISYSVQKIWDGDSVVVDHSGTFSDTYKTITEKHNETTGTWTRGYHDIDHEANYSWVSNTTIIGNITVDIELQVYKVDIDYGANVRLIWVALEEGTLEMEYFLSYKNQNFSYYEEYTQNRENHWEMFNYSANEWMDMGNTTDLVSGIKSYNRIKNNSGDPYFSHLRQDYEFSIPLIMTLQLFTTGKKDRIAWVNMFKDFYIYEDLDFNAIYSVADLSYGSVPQMSASKENVGRMTPGAVDGYFLEEEIGRSEGYWKYPSDRSINQIASQINFTEPTVSGMNVSWGIEYPDMPTYVSFGDWENYFGTDINASFAHSCPNDYSYNFDYTIGDNFTSLDTTWELRKVTNSSFYDVVQGYGLTMPQYNYFLSSFNIDEVDPKELTLPSDVFSFKSNNTVVAELNMGGRGKDTYTLYDFPTTGTDSEHNFQGGSVHPIVVAYDQLSMHSDDSVINVFYLLDNIVSQDPTFTVADSLYLLNTQNYPIWSGEHLRHDPTLTIYYDSYEVDDESDGVIFGYNCVILIGAVGIITFVIILRKRKKY